MCGTNQMLVIVKVFSPRLKHELVTYILQSQEWYAKLCDNRKVITDRSIVFAILSRDYLKVVCYARHRIAMTRFGIRNNRLPDSWSIPILFLTMSVIVNVMSLIVSEMNMILFWNDRLIKT